MTEAREQSHVVPKIPLTYGSPFKQLKKLPLPLHALSQEGKLSLISAIQANHRAAMDVKVQTTMCFQRFINAEMMSEQEVQDMRNLLDKVNTKQGLKGPPRVVFINATELGGGVAEMRLDTVALVRDLGARAKWLVIDGADPFYKATVHMHEGIQNPKYAPLSQEEIETFYLTNLVNFLRLEQEHPPGDIDILWIDDPQPIGVGLIVKTLFPQTLVIWRCHVHVDPEESIGGLIHDLVMGNLRDGRDDILKEFLKSRQHDKAGAYDGVVFHEMHFAANLKMAEHPGVHVMPPCINPLAFKNMLINNSLVESTLVKYGVMQPRVTRSACVPPFVLQVSRFDPYKGPLELITAFVEAVKSLPTSLQLEVALVMASSLPGDNPSGVRLARLLQEYIDSLDLSVFPQEMQAGGPKDLRKRIFLLLLDDKTPWERLCERLAKESDFDVDRLAGVEKEIQELADLGIMNIVERLETSGLIDPELGKTVLKDPVPAGVTFTSEQKAATAKVLSEARARRHPGGTAVTARRVDRGSLNGKEINAFEVSALQSSALVKVQFSSKEGFGLTVSESLVKQMPGYEGVMVTTLVGGIRAQAAACECLTIEYPPEEVAASLAVYRSLPDHPTQAYWDNLFKEIARRKSVTELRDHIRHAATMPDAERVRMSNAARQGVLTNFSTWVNVRNILNGIALAARLEPDSEAPGPKRQRTQP